MREVSNMWFSFQREVSNMCGYSMAVLAAALLALCSASQVVSVPSTQKLNCTSAAPIVPPGPRIQAVLFRDDFNSFSTCNWEHEVSMFGGLNWEFQAYTNNPNNVFTKDGNLYLQPTLTVDFDDPRFEFDENFLYNGKMDMTELFGVCTRSENYGCTREGKYGILPPVMSGKVMSIPTIRYGIVEVRARIPEGDWLWPSIWLMPKYRKYGEWPRSGEIDIMESRGNHGALGVEDVTSTLHWGPNPGQNRFRRTHEDKMASDWADDFHTWRLEWTPDYLVTFVDDEEIMRVGANFWQKGGFGGSNIWADGEKMAPFDQEFFLILNVAVGGTNGYFPDGDFYNGAKKPWINGTPWAASDFWKGRSDWLKTWKGSKSAMLVDYVEFRHL